jgi:hypothetical protein
MRIRPSLLFLLVALGLIVGVTWWRSRTVPVAADPAPSTDLAPSPQARASSRPARTGTSPRLARAGDSRARRAQRRAAVQRIAAAGRNKIVGRYEGENIDSAWANATRQELMKPEYTASDQIRAVQAEPANLAIDCRSTTCRINADFPNSVAADDWSTLYLTGVGDRLPNASMRKTRGADGSVHLEIYAIARR